jgi:hypothetical protein
MAPGTIVWLGSVARLVFWPVVRSTRFNSAADA